MDSSTQLATTLVALVLLQCVIDSYSTTSTMVNKGNYTVWPEIVSGAGIAPFSTIGFVPQPVKSNALARLPSWSGRLWGDKPSAKKEKKLRRETQNSRESKWKKASPSGAS
ncbi:hypothetical protein RYX36_004949 [Vicia faba]